MKRGGQHRKRRGDRGKRRSAVAAAGAMLLVPAVVAGEPAPWLGTAGDVAYAADSAPVELDDPRTLGADGSKPENAELGPRILELAGNPDKLALTAGPGTGYPVGPLGIPGNMLTAYMRAAQTLAATTPGCNLKWPLLASVGRIESNHAYGGKADANGTTVKRILGLELNGAGPVAAIADTDGGRYDGNTVWDHAVGPMQFIPSTWAGYASDGNGDGLTDPNNIFDAALGAGKYLCSGGLDLSDPRQMATAIFRYNNSDSYVRTVILWANSYARGVHPLPTTPVSQIPVPVIPPSNGDSGVVPPPGVTPTQPPSKPPASTTPKPTGTTSPKPTTTRPTLAPTSPNPSWGSTTTTTTTTTTPSPTCETSTPTTTAETTTPTTTTEPADDPCAPDPTDGPTAPESETTESASPPPSISVTPTAT
ncbi:lytic murein transglycosylase [Actinokineospora guangxiensis]|uniref:Lytic murein transglycosylase n=1 Tax=Actinokineospora guangxiensis TaxID=1490288 RepID=A0ABW0ELY4_9PSEU